MLLLPALRHSAHEQNSHITMADHSRQPAPSQPNPSPDMNFLRSTSSTSTQLPTTPTKPSTNLAVLPIATAMAVDTKNSLAISNLMSPPELQPFDSFVQGAGASPVRPLVADQQTVVARPPLSPPISPFTKPSSNADAAPAPPTAAKDPILYPASDIGSSPRSSLFSHHSEAQLETRRVVDEHITARPESLFRQATPPEREDYELALYFQSAVMQKFMENPGGWLRKERELLARDRKNGIMRSKFPTILPAASGKPSAARVQVFRTSNPNKVKKPRPHTPGGQANGSRIIRATPAGVSRQPVVRQTIRVSTTPEPRTRTVAPSREDKDFEALDDYCPPLSSLPSKANSLKVDWKGNALDLSNDPFVHLLHPDELLLAAGLRLDCATYLTSKRRIFIRRLECAKIGKEFRKTDAQQACKIDVNKASKLWTAYDKVGWLSIHWMKRFL